MQQRKLAQTINQLLTILGAQYIQRGLLHSAAWKPLCLHQHRKIMVPQHHPFQAQTMYKTQYPSRIWTAIHQISDEPQLITITIAHLIQQPQQSIQMPMHIANRKNRHIAPL